MNYMEQLSAARRVSVPIVAINTPDPESTIQTLRALQNKETPILVWDIIAGIRGLNDAGKAAEHKFHVDEFDVTKGNPVACLERAAEMPVGALLIVHLAPHWLKDAPYIQALWNLRDNFKLRKRMCCLLGKEFALPAELQDDVIVIDEPLPDSEQLERILKGLIQSANLPEIESLEKPIEAILGLSAFAAEQVTAMCLSRKGIDLESLWERKRSVIEQTPGLKVFRHSQSFEEIGGCGVIKDFLTRVMAGKDRPNTVVFIDEIEKAMGGKGDTSGVSQDQLGAILSYMQDNNSTGMIFVGPPGAAKSAIAKAAGTAGGIPTIQLDLGACKGSLVGQSEQQMRTALKVITATSNGRSLWIATCNSINELPPELRRRFTLGTYFFDLPDEDERNSIWAIYTRKYNLIVDDAAEAISDAGWTGAEIRQCCEIAWRLDCTLAEAAAFVVPVSVSAAGAIQQLRKQSDGKFLSASYPGVYRMHREAVGCRTVELED